MRQKLEGLLRSPALPFVALLAVQLLCHLTLDITAGGGDDAYYATIIPGEGLWSMVVRHYGVWSARSILEVFEAVVSWLPPLVWRLVNPAIITLCARGIAAMCGAKGNARVCWVLCGLFMVYPWPLLSSAGWRVTTVVYVWTAAALLGALWPMVKLMRGERPSRLAYALAVPCTLYAINMEQVLVIAVAAIVLYLAYRLVNRQGLPAFLLLQLLLCAAMLAYTLASPGVKERFAVETTSAYLDFNMLSFFEKLELGVSSALVPLVYERDFLFDGFCLLLALVVWQNNRGVAFRAIGMLPAAVSLSFSYLLPLAPGVRQHFLLAGNKGFITLASFASPAAWLPLLLLYMTFILCLVNVYVALGHRPLSLAACGALVCGLLSRATMGFSPTVVSSGARTGFYFSLALIAVCCILLLEVERSKRLPWLGIYGYTAVLAAWRTLGFLRH